MSAKLDQIWLRIITPLSWPLVMRRLFLLTLPISAPLYLLVIFAMIAVMALWLIWMQLSAFWNAPRRRVRSGYYAYETRRRRRSHTNDAPRSPMIAGEENLS